MIICVASLEDLEAIVALWRQLVDDHASLEEVYEPKPDAEVLVLEHFRRILTDDDRLLLVCRGESVFGFLSASIRPAAPVFNAAPVGVLNELAVAPDFRRRGIGRRLCEHARAWLQERGVRRVEVHTLTGNLESNEFWKKLGFEAFATELKASTEGG